MTRRVLLLAVAVVAVSLPVHPTVRGVADTPHPQALTALVAADSLTRDTNGDGLADVVAARVIVPANPSPADLEIATKAGFSYLMANVKYLRDGQYTVQRIEEDAARDSVSLTTLRIRPVMPGKTPPSPARPTTTTSTPGTGTRSGGK